MKAKILSLAALVCAAALPAHAETQGSGWYGELGYLAMNLKNDYAGGSDTVTPTMSRFVVGKEVSDHFAVEGMLGMTISKGKIQQSQVSDTLAGIYLKPFTNLTTDTSFFGRIGYATNAGKSEHPRGSSTWNSSQVSYGIGIQTQFTNTVYGAIDYMNYGKKSLEYGESIVHSGITASIGMRF